MAEDQGEAQMSINSAFYGYPLPKKGPETAYVTKPGSNPILRGTALSVAGWACVSYHVMYTPHNVLIKPKGRVLQFRWQLFVD